MTPRRTNPVTMNNNYKSSSGRPRASSTRHAQVRAEQEEEVRADRKRVQNRLSQQCCREKKKAQSAHLEMLASVIQSSSGVSAERRETLVNAQLQLLKENEELKEALLRLRKKLLSLSSSGSAAAQDPIFDRILGKNKQSNGNKRRRVSVESDDYDDDDSPSPEPQTNEDQGFDGIDFMNLAEAGVANSRESSESATSVHRLSVSNNDVRPLRPVADCNTSSWFSTDHVQVQTANMFADSYSEYMILPCTEDSPFNPTMTLSYNNLSNGFFKSPLQETHIKLEEATLIFLASRFNLSHSRVAAIGMERGQAAQIQAIRQMLCTELVDDNRIQLLSDAAVTFTRLLCRYAGQEAYVFGVGNNAMIEAVTKWRLIPTIKNRLAIPEPYRPTPLQYNTTSYPLSINLVAWSSIRDQLILSYGRHDMNDVIKEIALHTVIDVPALRMAFSVRDVFFLRVQGQEADQRDATSRRVCDSGPPHPATRHNIYLQVAREMEELTRKHEMERWSLDILQDCGDSAGEVARPCGLSTVYGLDNFIQWRLSIEFAAKFPWLDCSEVTAMYPLQPAVMSPAIDQASPLFDF